VEQDYALYRDLLAAHCAAADVAVWAWCLMPNHVHLILVPSDRDGLRRALRQCIGLCRDHQARRDAADISGRPLRRNRDGRAHLAAALRYVSLIPCGTVVQRAQDWRWSSARAHLPAGRRNYGACAVRERFARFATCSMRSRTKRRSPGCGLPKASVVRSATIVSSQGSSA